MNITWDSGTIRTPYGVRTNRAERARRHYSILFTVQWRRAIPKPSRESRACPLGHAVTLVIIRAPSLRFVDSGKPPPLLYADVASLHTTMHQARPSLSHSMGDSPSTVICGGIPAVRIDLAPWAKARRKQPSLRFGQERRGAAASSLEHRLPPCCSNPL